MARSNSALNNRHQGPQIAPTKLGDVSSRVSVITQSGHLLESKEDKDHDDHIFKFGIESDTATPYADRFRLVFEIRGPFSRWQTGYPPREWNYGATLVLSTDQGMSEFHVSKTGHERRGEIQSNVYPQYDGLEEIALTLESTSFEKSGFTDRDEYETIMGFPYQPQVIRDMEP